MGKKKNSEVTYSSKTDRHDAHKHLFGSGNDSDFIINMTPEKARKLSGRYALIALILIAVSSLPYYISKAFESGNDFNMLQTESNATLAFLIMTLLILAGFGGILMFIIACVKKEIRLNKNKLTAVPALILVMTVVSALASSDIGTSVFGYLDRAEGLVTIIGYFGFFALGLALTSGKYRKKAADAVIIIASVNALMGILQSIPALGKFIPSYYNFLFIDYRSNIDTANYFNSYAGYDASYAADGFCCSPFALGALLTVGCAFAVNGAALAKKLMPRLLYIAAAGIMSGAAILTQTLPAMLGVGAAIVISLALSFAGKNKDDDGEQKPRSAASRFGVSAICLAIAAAVFAGIFFTDNFRFRNERIIYTDSFERLQISYGAHSPHSDGIFPTLWYEGALTFEKNPVLGVGPDNWAEMYNGGEGMETDRAYNEYLDTAITRGVITAVLQIALIIITLVKAIRLIKKRGGDPVALGAFTAFAAYAIQAFFNISSASCTPYFYLTMGMIWCMEAGLREKAK